MSRSHVLLHCPSAGLAAVRKEEWECRDPGSIRVLLANPPVGELLSFLELSGVGRVMADGTDEDGARAARMEYWNTWEVEEEVARRAN